MHPVIWSVYFQKLQAIVNSSLGFGAKQELPKREALTLIFAFFQITLDFNYFSRSFTQKHLRIVEIKVRGERVKSY